MKVGFIGFGNMAYAMANGMVKSGRYAKENITVSSRNLDLLSERASKIGVNFTTDNIKVVRDSDIIFLTIKPYLYKDIINEIKDYLTDDKIIVTVAPGISISDIKEIVGFNIKVLRTMPNTPALVMQGMTCFTASNEMTEEDIRKCYFILTSFGKAEQINEKQMDAIVPLTGSSPAYVFMMIEAMADEAVLEGIERKKAYKLAAQAVLGSCQMVLETNMHPGELKDMVTSPGGTTIEAVRSLEKTGFRSSIIEAMKACSNKAKKLDK